LRRDKVTVDPLTRKRPVLGRIAFVFSEDFETDVWTRFRAICDRLTATMAEAVCGKAARRFCAGGRRVTCVPTALGSRLLKQPIRCTLDLTRVPPGEFRIGRRICGMSDFWAKLILTIVQAVTTVTTSIMVLYIAGPVATDPIHSRPVAIVLPTVFFSRSVSFYHRIITTESWSLNILLFFQRFWRIHAALYNYLFFHVENIYFCYCEFFISYTFYLWPLLLVAAF